MARTARPWYFTEKKSYAATVRGRRVILLKGERNPTNERLAAKHLRPILNPSRNGDPHGPLRVADVIDRYLNLHRAKYSDPAFAERQRYLQQFAEAHGWRKVNDRDCLPVHVAEWLAAHPQWVGEWTKAQIVSIILRPFNWAAKKRLLPSNPCRGVEQAEGEPRRPLTDAEFQALLRNATAAARVPRRPRRMFRTSPVYEGPWP